MSFLFATYPRRLDLGLTLLRLVTGLIFTMHGYQKLFVMGFAGVTGAFTQMGAPLPGISGPLFAVCEIVFGIVVILGLLTRLGSLWFIIDMLGAIAVVHLKNGWSGRGGMEFPVLLLIASVVIFLGGPGAYAIDNALAARRGGAPSA
jgi:putative oxidoreductase